MQRKAFRHPQPLPMNPILAPRSPNHHLLPLLAAISFPLPNLSPVISTSIFSPTHSYPKVSPTLLPPPNLPPILKSFPTPHNPPTDTPYTHPHPTYLRGRSWGVPIGGVLTSSPPLLCRLQLLGGLLGGCRKEIRPRTHPTNIRPPAQISWNLPQLTLHGGWKDPPVTITPILGGSRSTQRVRGWRSRTPPIPQALVLLFQSLDLRTQLGPPEAPR